MSTLKETTKQSTGSKTVVFTHRPGLSLIKGQPQETQSTPSLPFTRPAHLKKWKIIPNDGALPSARKSFDFFFYKNWYLKTQNQKKDKLLATPLFRTVPNLFPFSIVEAGYKAHGYTCDLTKKTQIDDVSAKIKAEVGDVSILINNAGVVNGKSLLELTEG